MKIVGLLSGGKDSVFNLLECVASYGHELVCVATLKPEVDGTELDSFMYQTVGVEIVPYISQCLEVPLISRTIIGKPLNTELYYETEESKDATDEVEDLYVLLKQVKNMHPEVQAVASGAICSNYQRLRVEQVCARLGLFSLAYLWQRDQTELL